MKGLITILLTAALLWTQAVGVMAAPQKAAKAGCQACDCAIPNCCLASAPQSPAPEPVAPASSPVQLKSQWIATVVAMLLPPSSDADLSPAPGTVSSLQLNAVPLHLRHCIFLI